MTEREKELLGTIEGLTNWLSVLRQLTSDTDCNPDDPYEFDEILLCCELEEAKGRKILEKYRMRT